MAPRASRQRTSVRSANSSNRKDVMKRPFTGPLPFPALATTAPSICLLVPHRFGGEQGDRLRWTCRTPVVGYSIVSADEACERLAARQHGVLSRRQALAEGMSDRGVDRRIERGRWQILHRGIYKLRSWPTSWHMRLMA